MHGMGEDNFCHQVLMEQVVMGWDGITREVKEIARKVGMKDVCQVKSNRAEVEEAILHHHCAEMKKEMENYVKLDKIKFTNFSRMPEYMKEVSLEDCRVEFLWRTRMLDTRVNMGKKYKEKVCPHCEAGVLETQEHWLVCAAYGMLREGAGDPEGVQRNRPSYLRRVIKRRKQLEEKLNKDK